MLEKNNRALVAMSGGVDSSVAAAVLKERGYEVIGITITPFKIDSDCRTEDNVKRCCSYQSTLDANEVCEKLGIEHRLIDLTDKFREVVVDSFIDEYMSGRTPNPCVNCNPIIKWGELLKRADAAGAYYMATGHYANVGSIDNGGETRFYIERGLDSGKDQSYFLWKLSQEQLARTLFPLGKLHKSETRELAKKYGLSVQNKAESQEVCFIPNDDYRAFLKKNVPDIEKKTGKGDILYNGKKIGEHEGYPFYTIGQRRGLGVAFKEPLYVKDIIPETNTVIVDTYEEILDGALYADSVNLMKYCRLTEARNFTVKIRYKHTGDDGLCSITPDGRLKVEFGQKIRAITPGQSVVIYEGNDLVGGGVIRERS